MVACDLDNKVKVTKIWYNPDNVPYEDILWYENIPPQNVVCIVQTSFCVTTTPTTPTPTPTEPKSICLPSTT